MSDASTPARPGLTRMLLLTAVGTAASFAAAAQTQGAAPNWITCARENQVCSFGGQANVRYGANGTYFTKSLPGGSPCNNATFGDPTPGVVKQCQYDESSRSTIVGATNGQQTAAIANSTRGFVSQAVTEGGGAKTAPAAGGGGQYQPLPANAAGEGQYVPLPANAAGPGHYVPLPANAAGEGNYTALPANAAGPGHYVPLPANAAGEGNYAPLPANAAGEGHYVPLPANAAGQGHYVPLPTDAAGAGHYVPLPANAAGAAAGNQYQSLSLAPGGQNSARDGSLDQYQYQSPPKSAGQHSAQNPYGPPPNAPANAANESNGLYPAESGVGGKPGASNEGQFRASYQQVPSSTSGEYSAPPNAGANGQYGELGKVPEGQGILKPTSQYGPAPVPAGASAEYSAPPNASSKGQYGDLSKVPEGQGVLKSTPADQYGAPPRVASGANEYHAPPVVGAGNEYHAPPVTGKVSAPVEKSPTLSEHVAGVGGAAGDIAGAGALGAGVAAGTTAITLAAQGKPITYHAPTTWNTNTTAKDLCWRDSYPNGGGVVQNGCPADREWRDSMCYKKCNPGETGSMTMCKSDCPAGTRTDPLTCWRDASITSADNSKCPWYDKCGLISAKGCSVCPAGAHNDGCTCRIDAQATARTRDVGIGIAGSGCQAGYSKDPSGLLCYPTCKAGYQMVGPVCWDQQCPADYPIQCGASCAVSHDACALSTESQVLTPLQVVTNVVGIALTGGASAGAEVGAEAAANGAKTAAEAGGEAASKAAIEASLKAQAAKMGKTLTESAASSAAGTMASASMTGQFDYYSLDPTGVAQVVEAYNKPICNVPNQ